MADSHTLSSRSAFSALTIIALNTVLLPSGKILNLPAKYNFSLGSSPIICIAATLESIIRFLIYTIRTLSFIYGLEAWSAFRFGDIAGDGEGSTESMRGNKWFVGCFFVFGALPQALKVFTTKGVPIIQACCAAYLATFSLDITMVLLSARFGSKPREKAPPLREIRPPPPQQRQLGWLEIWFLASTTVLAHQYLHIVLSSAIVAPMSDSTFWALSDLTVIIIITSFFPPMLL